MVALGVEITSTIEHGPPLKRSRGLGADIDPTTLRFVAFLVAFLLSGGVSF